MAESCDIKGCQTVAVIGFNVRLCVSHRDAVLNELATYLARRTFAAHMGKSPTSADEWAADPTVNATAAPKQAFVYFLRRERLIKIGYSIDPVIRASGLNAELLAAVPGDWALEKKMHAQFAHLRSTGEWFEPGEDLVGYINALRYKDQLPDITP